MLLGHSGVHHRRAIRRRFASVTDSHNQEHAHAIQAIRSPPSRRPPRRTRSGCLGSSWRAATVVVAALGSVPADLIGTRLLGFSQSPISPIMVAIIVGMLVANLIRTPKSLQAGVRFSVRKLPAWASSS